MYRMSHTIIRHRAALFFLGCRNIRRYLQTLAFFLFTHSRIKIQQSLVKFTKPWRHFLKFFVGLVNAVIMTVIDDIPEESNIRIGWPQSAFLIRFYARDIGVTQQSLKQTFSSKRLIDQYISD